MKTGFIYSLSDPNTQQVKYIGQTINLEKRIGLHLYHSKNGKARTHKEKWINTLLANNLKPELNILWKGSTDLLDTKETEFIALFKSFGAKLTNATFGGTTTRGRKCSEETKLKLSLAQKGRPRDWKYSETTLQKMRDRMKGFKHNDESKRKLSIARKGKPSIWTNTPMPEHLKNQIANIGKKSRISVIAIKDNIETAFPSYTEAAKFTGSDRKNIRLVIRGIHSQSKGYTFKLASHIQN